MVRVDHIYFYNDDVYMNSLVDDLKYFITDDVIIHNCVDKARYLRQFI